MGPTRERLLCRSARMQYTSEFQGAKGATVSGRGGEAKVLPKWVVPEFTPKGLDSAARGKLRSRATPGDRPRGCCGTAAR